MSLEVDLAPVGPGADGADRRGGGAPSTGPRPPSVSGRAVAIAAGVVAAVLVALALWPQPGPSVQQPAIAGPGTVGAWPARGELAADERVLRDVTAAWRTSDLDGAPEPGRDVEPLYLGRVGEDVSALLRSTTAEGRTLVAAAVVDGDEWRMLDVRPVDRDVSWLTLPGGDLPRVLVAPEVAAASALWVRRSDGVWTRVAARDDGVTFGLRSNEGPTLLGVVRGRGVDRTLIEVASLSSTAVLPQPAPVDVAAPQWGRGAGLSAEEYDAALYASRAFAEPPQQLAVLASTRVPGGRAVLVEVDSADGGGTSHRTVVPGPDGEPTWGPQPLVRDNLAVSVVPRGGGRALVLVASSPSVARVEVRKPDGEVLVGGTGPTAVVLAPPAPSEVRVLGKRTSGAVTTSLTSPVVG